MDELIRARYSMLYVVTWEENRARKLIYSIARKQKKPLYEWSITEGVRTMTPSENAMSGGGNLRKPLEILQKILKSDGDGIYILTDFYHYLDEPEVVRKLRDLSRALKSTRKSIVFMASQLKLPDDLEKSVTIVDLPLPDYGDIKKLLTTKIIKENASYKIDLNDEELDKIIKAAIGLTYDEAENAYAKAIVGDGVLSGDDIQVILDEKRQIIRKTGVLEDCDIGESIASVGGMELLKDWLEKRERAFSEEAREYGLPRPRGILLMGIQGCGKSLVAKTVASSWNLPLLRLDMSLIFREYIGSSEQNMRKAMKLAEGIAPVVLWIDEIEKAFAGTGSGGSNDGGTTARVLGSFLTWLQEKKNAVFVVATANQVAGLPPELLRKGRLDEIFFVDLPTPSERHEIFCIHLKKKNRDPAIFDINKFVDSAQGFSGAEIEQVIIAALHDSFFEHRELTSDDILRNITVTVPLSETMREQINDMRQWSRDRARPVSPPAAQHAAQ